MKKFLTTFWLATLAYLSLATAIVILPLQLAEASNTANATYVGIIRVTNNGTSTLTNVSVNVTIPTAHFITNNYLNASGNNSAILTAASADTAYQPSYTGTTVWAMRVPSIAPNSVSDFTGYFGGLPSMVSKMRYFPDVAGATITDAAAPLMEHGDNFTDEWSGYLNTSSTWNNGTALDMNGASNAYAWKNTPTDIKHAAGSFVWWGKFGSVAANQKLIGYVTNGATDDEWTVSFLTGTNRISIALVDAGATTFEAHSGTVTINDTTTWHQVVVTSDGATLKLYIDGQPVTLTVTTGANTGQFTHDAVNANALVFGILKRAALTQSYTGLMDEIRFYNRELTATEVADHYTGNGISNTDTGLLDLWRMNEGTGATTANSANGTATSNTLTLVNTGWAQSTLNMGMPSLVSKPGAIWVANSGSGNITAQIMNSSANVTATGVASGEKTVKLEYTPNLLTNSSFETADPPTDWTLAGAGATVSRSNVQFHEGAYSALLTRNGANTNLTQDFAGFASYANQTVTLGMWVYATVASRAYIALWDGVSSNNSAFHSGVAGWEWLTTSLTLSPAPVFLRAFCNIDGGDTSAYFDGAILIVGSSVADYNTLRLYIDGVDSARTYTEASVPDNANNWNFLQNNVMPYMEYQKIWVGGNLRQHIVWENDTTFTDLSGNGNDLTPSFKTDSDSPYLSAQLITFLPVTFSTAADAGVLSAGTFISANGTAPFPRMYTELESGNLTGGEFWDSALTASGTPKGFFWFPFVFGASILAGMIIYKFTGSLFVQFFVMAFVLGIFTFTILPWWAVVIFCMDGMAVAIAGRQFGW